MFVPARRVRLDDGARVSAGDVSGYERVDAASGPVHERTRAQRYPKRIEAGQLSRRWGVIAPARNDYAQGSIVRENALTLQRFARRD